MHFALLEALGKHEFPKFRERAKKNLVYRWFMCFRDAPNGRIAPTTSQLHRPLTTTAQCWIRPASFAVLVSSKVVVTVIGTNKLWRGL
jgi:hypothetical protein